MAEVKIQNNVVGENYNKVIDTEFKTFIIPVPTNINQITIEQFFTYYDELFYQIPKLGDINSHQYLVVTSGAYIGSTTPNDDTIQALIEEVTQLRQENLDLQQQIISGSI